MKTVVPMVCVCMVIGGFPLHSIGQVTKDEVDAAKNALDLRVYQATTELLIHQKEAEARKAIAEAEKAEMLAKVPPTDSKAPQGTVNTDKFGAAGLVRAFDLAKALAHETCSNLSKSGTFTIYDTATIQGVVSAKLIKDEMPLVKEKVNDAATVIDRELKKADPKPDRGELIYSPLFVLPFAVATAGIKAVADLTSLFKTNIVATGTPYGNDTRSLFITALAEDCPKQLIGLGGGYLGELDTTKFDELKKEYRSLVEAKGNLTDKLNALKKKIDAQKDASNKESLSELYANAAAVFKTADTFIDALKANDTSDKGPLFNAARYLAYSARTAGANVLDFELRLDGLTVTKENIFVGQRLRMSGVAFLTYRLHAPAGNLLQARAERRIDRPVEVDLRGEPVSDSFWGPSTATFKH